MPSDGKMVREVNWAGPCLFIGTLIGETEKFWLIEPTGIGRRRRIKKDGLDGKYHIHFAPCQRCTDHPKTTYPRGYDL